VTRARLAAGLAALALATGARAQEVPTSSSAVPISEGAAQLPSASSGPHGAVPEDEVDGGGLLSPTGPFGAVIGGEGIDESILGLDVRLYLNRGINYRVEEQFTLFDRHAHLDGRIGLRFQLDAAAFAPDDVTGAHGGVKVRRAYFYTTGELRVGGIPILFSLDLGFQSDGFFVDDAYLWLADLPWVGTFKIGQFTAPMSIANLTSSSTRPFMELATPVEAFAPGSKAGLQLANDAFESRLTWQLGWFADTQAQPVGDASESVTRVVGRLTGLPILGDDSVRPELLHLGMSASFVQSNQQVRYRSRPESFLAPEIVDTGDIGASGAGVLGLEAAWVDGSLSLQSELLGSKVEASDQGTPLLFGLYAMGSLFLTGEARPYDRTSAVFGAVVPNRPLSWTSPGLGAWEVAGRVSYIDLSDDGVRGGEVFTLMAGVNWYWNRYVRLLFEYGFSDARDGPQTGGLHIFQTRLQVNV
jgi:phosphate-selective porin OprO/OprP